VPPLEPPTEVGSVVEAVDVEVSPGFVDDAKEVVEEAVYEEVEVANSGKVDPEPVPGFTGSMTGAAEDAFVDSDVEATDPDDCAFPSDDDGDTVGDGEVDGVGVGSGATLTDGVGVGTLDGEADGVAD